MEWLMAALLLAGVVLLILVWRKLSTPDSSTTGWKESTAQLEREFSSFRNQFQEQISSIHKLLGDQYSQNTRFLVDSHRQYSDSVEKFQNRLGELQESTRTMALIGRDIASLQDILKTPKLRGGLGEFFLGQLLAQILPQEYFELQYMFKDGSKVDAVIRLGDGLVPVDAKFPLENFRRFIEEKDEDAKNQSKKAFIQDVKKHIDAIASKYILPQEGTYDFALMYIPAENVYYELILKSEQGIEGLSDYAMKRKVVPVSPNSFYAYLQSISRGLKGLRIEKSALQVLKALEQLATDFAKMTGDMEKVGGHLSNAQSAYERASKGFDRIQSRLAALGTQRAESLLESGTTAE